MRNLKKMAALGAAAVMALSVNVSAFAAVTGSATASYDNGKVILNSLADIDATHQWTVVVINKADENTTLTADKLYYINQGTSEDKFWTDGMGTRTELADGEYIVRIGGETIDTLDKLIEIPLKISTLPSGIVDVIWGDVDLNGSVDTGDAGVILNKLAGGTSTYTNSDNKSLTISAAYGTTISGTSNILWGDIDLNGSVDTGDAGVILNKLAGGTASFSGPNNSTFVIGHATERYTITQAN